MVDCRVRVLCVTADVTRFCFGRERRLSEYVVKRFLPAPLLTVMGVVVRHRRCVELSGVEGRLGMGPASWCSRNSTSAMGGAARRKGEDLLYPSLQDAE